MVYFKCQRNFKAQKIYLKNLKPTSPSSLSKQFSAKNSREGKVKKAWKGAGVKGIMVAQCGCQYLSRLRRHLHIEAAQHGVVKTRKVGYWSATGIESVHAENDQAG